MRDKEKVAEDCLDTMDAVGRVYYSMSNSFVAMYVTGMVIALENPEWARNLITSADLAGTDEERREAAQGFLKNYPELN